jgi:hypothetical protein
MDEGENASTSGSGKIFLIILIVVILAVALAAGWYFFIKKSAEGGTCSSDSKCESGLTCANKTCSSGASGSSCESKDNCQAGYCVNNKCTEGKTGDNCSAKTDCTTGYCVNSKCTEGKLSDACSTYKDCAAGLYCKQGACSTPPDYSKYFAKIVISRINPGSGPEPNNPATVTTTFKTTDALEIDFTGVKSTTVGEYHYEIVDSVSGEIARSSKNELELKFSGQDTGTGTSLDNVAPGEYDLNIYFKDELVYTTQIIVSK